jgi:glyoxylase-like metal-dependent hydrolase (beta-lactamase superfamily II)
MHPAEYCRYANKGNSLDGVLPLWEGASIELGTTTLDVVLVPGHTPGSIALLDRARHRLFVGDTLSDAWIYMFGDGRSMSALIESLEKLEDLAPLIRDIHPSHGSPVLGIEWIEKTKVAAQKTLAGEIFDTDPPRNLPCRNYSYKGVNLYYQPQGA